MNKKIKNTANTLATIAALALPAVGIGGLGFLQQYNHPETVPEIGMELTYKNPLKQATSYATSTMYDIGIDLAERFQD